MVASQQLTYDDFILINDHLSFHPGGLIATFNVLSNIPNISKEETILDFGCGNGSTLAFLKKLGFKNLIGYDRNINAVEQNRNKWTDIKFYSDFDTLLSEIEIVDFLLLESVFSFNDNSELKMLSESIQQIKEKTKIKYIGIIDFYLVEKVSMELEEKMKRTFGIKDVRTIEQFQNITKSFSETSTISYFNDHIFFINLSEKYKTEEQVSKVMSSEIFANNFGSEKNAKSFFSNFINDMLSSYSSFNQHFKYFECVVTL